jgi:hypothetical protein
LVVGFSPYDFPMISQKRIVNLFRRTGGGDEFTKSADELTGEERARMGNDLDAERALIASVPSNDKWFVVTPLHLVVKNSYELRRIPLEHIERIVATDSDYKLHGGNLGVRLHDGSIVNLGLQSARPYISLMNVFMYIARVTGSPSDRGLASSPTTDDGRPAAKL